MQLSFSLQGINDSIKALQEAGFAIQKDFKGELISQGNNLRDRAKQILAEKSQQRTGQKYWTGKLQDAIKSEVQIGYNDYSSDVTGIRVGVDLRSAPYAEWVEIGHRTSNPFTGEPTNKWWEGYHYLEGAYLELGPGMASKIRNTLVVSLSHFNNKSGRTRSKATGQFTKGNFIVK